MNETRRRSSAQGLYAGLAFFFLAGLLLGYLLALHTLPPSSGDAGREEELVVSAKLYVECNGRWLLGSWERSGVYRVVVRVPESLFAEPAGSTAEAVVVVVALEMWGDGLPNAVLSSLVLGGGGRDLVAVRLGRGVDLENPGPASVAGEAYLLEPPPPGNTTALRLESVVVSGEGDCYYEVLEASPATLTSPLQATVTVTVTTTTTITATATARVGSECLPGVSCTSITVSVVILASSAILALLLRRS